mgnify:CR=1 FL=1
MNNNGNGRLPDALAGIVYMDEAIDLGIEMAQELQEIYDDIQSDGGGPEDGAHIRQLVERWECFYRRFEEWLEGI